MRPLRASPSSAAFATTASTRGSSAAEAQRSRSRPARPLRAVGAVATLFAEDTEVRPALFRHLLEQGVYVAPSQFEAMFISLAHGDEEIEEDGGRGCRFRRLSSPTPCASPMRSSSIRLLAPHRATVRSASKRSTRGLVHGRPRLLRPEDDDTALVLGDYFYAQGLARSRR